jgi:3-hydroxybutyryl-CoA dehydrogenase
LNGLGIAGARGIGTTLARLALRAGLQVTLFDQNAQNLDEAREKLTRGLRPTGGKQETESAAGTPPTMSLQTTANIADLAEMETVIEAVADTRDGKRALLARLEAACSEHTVLCTTLSTQSVSALGSTLSRPEMLIGLHIPRPVASARALEVVPGLRTSQATIDRVLTLAQTLRKTPIVVKNRPGLIVDRLAGMMRLEAVYAVEEGVADASTIDALHTAMGFAAGPLAQLDAIGLNHALATSRALFDGNLGESRFRPSLLLVEMVDAGWTGRSAGKGFHDYPTL